MAFDSVCEVKRPEYVNSVRTLCQLRSAEHIEKIVLHTHSRIQCITDHPVFTISANYMENDLLN